MGDLQALMSAARRGFQGPAGDDCAFPRRSPPPPTSNGGQSSTGDGGRSRNRPVSSVYPRAQPQTDHSRGSQGWTLGKHVSQVTAHGAFRRLESETMHKSPSMPCFACADDDAEVITSVSNGSSRALRPQPNAGPRPRGQSPEHSFAFNTDRYWRTYSFDVLKNSGRGGFNPAE